MKFGGIDDWSDLELWNESVYQGIGVGIDLKCSRAHLYLAAKEVPSIIDWLQKWLVDFEQSQQPKKKETP